MSKYVLTVTLNPAIDKVFTIKNFRAGKEFRCFAPHSRAGGKGVNVARTLKVLGVPAIAAGLAGGAAGGYLVRALVAEGIRNDFSGISGETRTNLTIIDSDRHQSTRVIERGPMVSSREVNKFGKKFLRLLEKSWCVIFSGSACPGVKDSQYADFMTMAKQRGVVSVLDSRGSFLTQALKSRPFLVKPNIEEAEEFIGRKVDSSAALKAALRDLNRHGAENVIISLGARGAAGYDGANFFRVSVPQFRGADTVGCGDAMIAGFVFALSRGKSFKGCLSWAAAAGTAKVSVPARGFPGKSAITKILPRLKFFDL